MNRGEGCVVASASPSRRDRFVELPKVFLAPWLLRFAATHEGEEMLPHQPAGLDAQHLLGRAIRDLDEALRGENAESVSERGHGHVEAVPFRRQPRSEVQHLLRGNLDRALDRIALVVLLQVSGIDPLKKRVPLVGGRWCLFVRAYLAELTIECGVKHAHASQIRVSVMV